MSKYLSFLQKSSTNSAREGILFPFFEPKFPAKLFGFVARPEKVCEQLFRFVRGLMASMYSGTNLLVSEVHQKKVIFKNACHSAQVRSHFVVFAFLLRLANTPPSPFHVLINKIIKQCDPFLPIRSHFLPLLPWRLFS